jgi:hypothetical protein
MFSLRKSKAAFNISCISIMPSNQPRDKGISEGLAAPDDGGENPVAWASPPLWRERPAPARARAGYPRYSGRDAHATSDAPAAGVHLQASPSSVTMILSFVAPAGVPVSP